MFETDRAARTGSDTISGLFRIGFTLIARNFIELRLFEFALIVDVP